MMTGGGTLALDFDARTDSTQPDIFNIALIFTPHCLILAGEAGSQDSG